MKAHLALLWHMHQPYYRNMRTGESSMPWVRLHGIHSYYDMVSLHEHHPEIHATINFVPSLIKQLAEYVEERRDDEFLKATMMPAEDLSQAHREFILRNFFAAQPERMIKPHARYRSLFERLGADPWTADLTEATRFFTAQDYRDIQVYYNLVWFGFTAREELPEIRQMLESGGRFSEDDKGAVVEAQRRILGELMTAIVRLGASKNVEISTTPMYHPILPLLIDTRIARRAQPKTPLPESFRAPHLARHQVSRAVAYMEEMIGTRPRGMWPSEGSVCPEMIPMLVDAGIEWMATDEGILARSTVEGKPADAREPYIASWRGKSIPIVFRNRELSDRISFVYSGMDAENAADDFVGRLRQLEEQSEDGDSQLITVILDGENPWEHYRNSGRDFLTTLFDRLVREKIPTTTVGEFIAAHPPKQRIEKLASGSWINSDFSIWIGKPQKNQAWRHIKHTVEELGQIDNPHALDSLCAACGSDWLWWYDDDFQSAFKIEFDKIFRSHLENAFALAGKNPPPSLLEPIYHLEDSAQAFIEPPAFIHPDINGSNDSYFEWSNAARIDVHRFGGAMAQTFDTIDTILFGFDEDAFFLRFDPQDLKRGLRLNDDESICIAVLGKDVDFRMNVHPDKDGMEIDVRKGTGGGKGKARPEIASGRVLELRCPFACFSHQVGDEFALIIALECTGVEHKRYAHIRFAIPDQYYEKRMWTV